MEAEGEDEAATMLSTARIADGGGEVFVWCCVVGGRVCLRVCVVCSFWSLPS